MSAIVEFQNAEIQIQKERILHTLNFKMDSGAFVYLLGSTGSGKSTFLKSIYGALPLSGGHARVCGFDLNQLKTSQVWQLRRQMGIVFQDFKLWHDQSCAGNIDFVLKATGVALRSEREDRIKQVLERVGLWSKRNEKPHRLSGGEQQRLCVARAIVNQPKLIIADEATGNLDPASSEEILSLLREFNQTGTAVIFATHDMLLYNKYPARTFEFHSGTCQEKTLAVESVF